MKTLHAHQPFTILRGLVGSTVHGLQLEGSDDRDEMAVAIEPPEFLIGLGRARFDFDSKYQQGFEHHVERTQPEGVRSGPGDLDRTTYSLRKWMRLATDGNPTVLLLLFVPEREIDVLTDLGIGLRELTPHIVSKNCGPRFLGYMHAQKLRLLGERGQKRVKRPELEEAHGYDTKYAMHVLRLAVQGVELMTSGRLTLPMADSDARLLRSVREGKLSQADVMDLVDQYEEQLGHAVGSSRLPDEPNWPRVNAFLIDAYRNTWGWT